MTSTTTDESTTSISPGATVTGVVNTNGDVDYFNINLVAGQTYSFSLAGSGSAPLIDPILSLTRAGVEVTSDDDGGTGTNSLVTFTATTTGTYQITAAAYPNSGLTGGYTLAVRQMGSDSVGSTFGSSTTIPVDATTYGF
ncbi:MAG: pre-peptidase C-terminal domain-containing protein, partial [Sphingomonas sp.]|nr:pre-peptidase C-terminal domain-containing protein [Sphingomonas sp.]